MLSKGFAATALALTIAFAGAARADVITDWNSKAEAIAIDKRIGPPPNARIMTIMHVAMFEAVNAVERRYSPYALKLRADKMVAKEAAAASAAHTVLSVVHPDRKADLDAALKVFIPANTEGVAAGIELGKEAATGILALRAKDGMDATESYRPMTQPGVYVPTVIPISSTLGATKPWVMETPSQFRPEPPPALTSRTWTDDLNETRELGGLKSTERTAEQTEIGRFWFMTGPQAWNPIVRQLAAARRLDIVDCARLFAVTSLAASDAFVAVFDAKYHYNFWRPLTAIRNADLTGNAATPRDPSWLPLGDTPMHPEYPCAHCISSSAVGVVLTRLFGDEIPQVSMTSTTAPGVTRKWTRIQDYTSEVSLARIVAGFHYRNSTRVGNEMGRKIGELTVATQLRRIEVSDK